MILRVAGAADDRLYVPHQVVREFWRNRQSVIAGLGSASKDAHGAMSKNATSTSDAISRWRRVSRCLRMIARQSFSMFRSSTAH